MSTHFPKKTSPSHGGVRGADFNRRSSQFEGRFGRIFRSLPAATWSEAALRKLAGDGQVENSMSAEPERDKTKPQLPTAPREDVEVDEKTSQASPRTSRLHDDEENSGINAGYTYLGVDDDTSGSAAF